MPRVDSKSFWDSVKRISDEQRKVPEILRRLSGVARGEFHVERLPPPAPKQR